MELSMRWARRSRMHSGTRQPERPVRIVQGGTHAGLRLESAAALREIGFDGYAWAARVGEPAEERNGVLDVLGPALPGDRRATSWAWHALGHRRGVARGIDMFDCVMPTRNARNGHLFTSQGW